MRTLRDRIRHMLLFELLLVAVCTPLLSRFLHKDMAQIGAVTIGLSVVAMLCNAGYNYAFDRLLLKLDRPLYPRSLSLRIGHSIGFEAVLLFFTVPLVMWWMGFSFLQAVAFDVAFALLVPVYALGFNWGYDLAFPAPAAKQAAGAS